MSFRECSGRCGRSKGSDGPLNRDPSQIAGLEATVASFHHRALVREAKSSLAQEIRHNKSEMDNLLKGLPKQQEQRKAALQFIDETLARRRHGIHEPSLVWVSMDLHSASWRTAETSGALGYMDY
jgi:hypothetical protein